MKNKLTLLLLAFLIFSCKQNEKEYNNNQNESINNNQSKNNDLPTINPRNITFPDKNQIMNDLLGKSVELNLR